MKWLFLVTLTLLAVSVFSAAFNKEEDVLLKELMKDEKEGADETETEEGEGRFVRETKEELEDEEEDEAEMAKSSLTENDENDGTQNDESEGNFPEMDEKEAPIDIKAAFDEKEDMTNENPEQ
ncbi:histone H2A.Z-specific chaperone CHZ1-like [Orbicella faveolata]|uniref:histone H2A.Z-specific chaperone CHZ1-like n=1 Tax=Orbicella faveolata TaxID=48498 RepID=UPI0009E38ED1|nr:histone H2A.Z-specific chaperone CHZ1-like [Orbicella faveolata]